jgi:hypothetical protein
MDDPTAYKFGTLEERVRSLDSKFGSMSEKLDTLADKIDSLSTLAERGKGAYWAALGLASLAGGVLATVVGVFKGHP